MIRLSIICTLYWETPERLNISFKLLFNEAIVCVLMSFCIQLSSQPLFSFKYLAYFVPTT